jgi:2-keto-4-pentenoate hydratase/2-oxohepta-3-ene-1,7-dioic acid hydratase in catechol pathway
MMKIARFRHKGSIKFGRVEDQLLCILEGDIFGEWKETDQRVAISDVQLLTPVWPSKIVCVGLNYREHIQELGVPIPTEPLIFLKPPSCLIGTGEKIIYPAGANRVDYEGELAVIIKEKMTRVSQDRVLNHVLGYSCFNDVTERDMTRKDPSLLTLAKGFDTFGSFGPYLATGLNPAMLELKTYLNGQLVQHDNTRNCVFSAKEILSFISRHMTLYPGDVVITGTPKGVRAMKPGDVVEVEIDGIGKLLNSVAAAET